MKTLSRHPRPAASVACRLFAMAACVLGTAAHAGGRLLDGFDSRSSWQPVASDEVSVELDTVPGRRGAAMQIRFDFNDTAGYAAARRRLPLDVAENFEITFDVRGAAPANNLEFKLIDASGDNVWWHARREFVPSSRWQTVKIRRSDIDFAWGPTQNRELRRVDSIEFVVSAGSGGGAGSLAFDELTLRELPADAAGAAHRRPSPNEILLRRALSAPRGHFPRGFSGGQSYWTLVGRDGGAGASALLSADGALEVERSHWTLEPFVRTSDGLITWAQIAASQSLAEDYLPIPAVTWRHDDWSLHITAFASETGEPARLFARYVLTNHTDRQLQLGLVLAVRPFQVNPPAQFLNHPGGFAPVRRLAWDGAIMQTDSGPALLPLPRPDRVSLSSLEHQTGLDDARGRPAPERQTERVTSGFGTALLRYELKLPARAIATVGVVLARPQDLVTVPRDDRVADWLAAQEAAITRQWREKLNRVELELPRDGKVFADTLRTALAHILMSRDGAALQPGTRAYARSWIRDGAMMAESLLRLDHGQAAADYLRWFAPRQFASGKVPCCVDRRGKDPVPENDSHGELIFLAAETYRYGRDRALLTSVWHNVAAAVRYMDALRASERSESNLRPERRAFFGLMPASISHEGYSAKSMHSYWDDFWALRGYKDAAWLAEVLGKHEEAAAFAAARDEFRGDLYASLARTRSRDGIAYLPGAAELGDFDATSTTIAMAPGGEQAFLPADALQATFDRYWKDFLERRDSRSWDAYTPYEWRTVGAFVRLGQRARAREVADYLMQDRRPPGWNQWPEVIGRRPDEPRFIGDLPHSWVASDFARSLLDVLAYERESDQSLVIAAGIPESWMAVPGVRVSKLRTPYGELNYSLALRDGELELDIAPGSSVPPGGFRFPWPWPQPPGPAVMNGRPAAWQHGEIHIAASPASLRISRLQP